MIVLESWKVVIGWHFEEMKKKHGSSLLTLTDMAESDFGNGVKLGFMFLAIIFFQQFYLGIASKEEALDKYKSIRTKRQRGTI
jgi:hypothetical protein